MVEYAFNNKAKKPQWNPRLPSIGAVDLRTIQVVPMEYRDHFNDRELKSCEPEDHQWVRSIIVSGKREMGKKQPIFWRVDTSIIWCETCGYRHPEKLDDHSRILKASDYYALMNPERTPFRGIAVSGYDNWVHSVSGDVHSDWESDQFIAGGWAR